MRLLILFDARRCGGCFYGIEGGRRQKAKTDGNERRQWQFSLGGHYAFPESCLSSPPYPVAPIF